MTYKIYKLTDMVTEKCYYGKTSQTLEDKLNELKQYNRAYLRKDVVRTYPCEIMENRQFRIDTIVRFENAVDCKQALEELLRTTICINHKYSVEEMEAKRKARHKMKIMKQREYRKRMSKIVTCNICQSQLTNMAQQQHLKSKKHIRNIHRLELERKP